ncbi:MAG: DNA repair protein [Lachnospiraceae bacterium]|jgi:nucleotidyltransferase/DNA polymerase involved in DNA repair
MKNHIYICIDLKSFYASVECAARHLDPMTTNLVVADPSRTEKTICLAVSPSLKAMGIPGRCRLFEIPKNIDFIIAPPRMSLYIDISARIYGIFLRYLSADDIHPYSIDECFMDVTDYLDLYGLSAKQLAEQMMADILRETGITSACGIGTNLYLCKIALDIMAKHEPDRIAYLDELSYREKLWDHRPITDFWRIGRGTARRLQQAGITTMRQVTQTDEDFLYRLFGVDAEILIDHAWGIEPVTIADIKAYKPQNTGLSTAQVLPRDTDYETVRLLLKEMADSLALDLTDQGMVTGSVGVHVRYARGFSGRTGAVRSISTVTSSGRVLRQKVLEIFDSFADPHAMYKGLLISYNHLQPEAFAQADLFNDSASLERDRRLQKAQLAIQKKYGKNALLKGMDLLDGATAIERNQQIGGHKSE